MPCQETCSPFCVVCLTMPLCHLDWNKIWIFQRFAPLHYYLTLMPLVVSMGFFFLTTFEMTVESFDWQKVHVLLVLTKHENCWESLWRRSWPAKAYTLCLTLGESGAVFAGVMVWMFSSRRLMSQVFSLCCNLPAVSYCYHCQCCLCALPPAVWGAWLALHYQGISSSSCYIIKLAFLWLWQVALVPLSVAQPWDVQPGSFHRCVVEGTVLSQVWHCVLLSNRLTILHAASKSRETATGQLIPTFFLSVCLFFFFFLSCLILFLLIMCTKFWLSFPYGLY